MGIDFIGLIKIDKNDKVWISYNFLSRAGVSIYDGTSIRNFELNDQLSSPMVITTKYIPYGDRMLFFTESGVDVDASTRNADPHGAEVFEHNMHVGRLAEDAHVGQHAVIDEVMRAASVAAIFLASEFSPLCLFDFAGDGCDDDVALQANARAL